MTTSDPWKRIEDLFEKALDLPVTRRSGFLAEQCSDDPDLRSRVESLLDEDARARADFLERPAVGPRLTFRADEPDSLIGRTLAAYTIKTPIARGGMGAVYLAEQSNPRRGVALKILHPSFWSQSAERRFDFEAQLLARLQHPHIGQIFEAGSAIPADADADASASAGARPVHYFAMEFVPNAAAITTFSDNARLDISARLELFLQAADAVQYGHQRGIIHRDLKPANILVAHDRPVPELVEGPEIPPIVKVIDFGVARCIDSDVALTTMHTDTGQLIGTLAYMSPEQCDADPLGLDVRSDVYSLGVVLYELICGRPPYEVSKTSVYAATRTIKEAEPLRPTAITGSGRRPAGRTSRDLETIILKSLEKDRNKRYASVADLAEDICRHLRGDSIAARPPTAWTRAIRWSLRHPLALTILACTAVAAISLTSIFASAWWLDRRPDRIEVLVDDATPEKLIRAVKLIARSRSILHTWPANPTAGVYPITFARMIDRGDGWPHERTVIIGYSNDAMDERQRNGLAAYNVDASPPQLRWLVHVQSEDLPQGLENSGADLAKSCPPARFIIADIFEGVEGPEIVVSHALGAGSPRCLRIYDLNKNVLFQVWQNGGIMSMHWLPGPRLLICTALDAQIKSELRQRKDLDEPTCISVFALRPENGRRLTEFMDRTSTDASKSPVWHRFLSIINTQKHPFRLLVGPSDGDDRKSHAKLKLEIDDKGQRSGFSFEIDQTGNEIPGSRRMDDVFESFQNRNPWALPPADQFRLQPIPPIMTRPSPPASTPARATESPPE